MAREPEDHLSRSAAAPNWLGALKTLDRAPEVEILLDQKLRAGIAAQLRTLANLLDPPERDRAQE